MQTIKFDRPSYFDSRGRNGYLPTYGVAILNMGTGDFEEVHIHPIPSRGHPSEACRVTIRKSTISDLIKALIDALGPPPGEITDKSDDKALQAVANLDFSSFGKLMPDRGIAPYAPSTPVEGVRGVRNIPLRRRKHMPKWQIDITRDISQDAEVVVEAETAEEAKQIFLHDLDRDVIEWREGDWLGDADVVKVLPARDDAELTALDAGGQKPRHNDGDTRNVFADIAGEIRRILEDNDAGKSRVVLDPEDVARLHGIAHGLGAMASVLTHDNPIA
jgi:hypothetical protein